MNESPPELLRILTDFDQKAEPFDEVIISTTLRKFLKDNPDREDLQEAFSPDMIAFFFAEGGEGQPSPWGTYFCPEMSGTDAKGNIVWANPCITKVSCPVIQTWKTRCDQFSNPIMQARYADLIWDLSETAIGKKPDVRYARIAIDAYVQIVRTKRYGFLHRAVHKLNRALSLALSINDQNRIETTKDALINLAKAEGNETPRVWCWCYTGLLAKFKTSLTCDREHKIIPGKGHRPTTGGILQ